MTIYHIRTNFEFNNYLKRNILEDVGLALSYSTNPQI